TRFPRSTPMKRLLWLLPACLALATVRSPVVADVPEGFTPLFNGKDFTGWKVPPGDNGHWKIVNGLIDYDAKSEAKGDKSLWTEKKYKDFVLLVDWRLKTDKGFMNKVPII